MILNYELHSHSDSTQIPVVFIHGLFGSLSNLGMLARAFAETHSTVQVDVRNHGKSGHSPEMNYAVMAQDILETLDDAGIESFCAVGHSMGGKIAMHLASAAPKRLSKLAVLDMAPVAYQQKHHEHIFKALFAVQQAQPDSRQQAVEIMRQFLSEDMVIQFLLKSFSKGQWLFNVDALYSRYSDILNWYEQPAWPHPALFLRGGNSLYVEKQEYQNAIIRQFPHAQIEVIEGAGHWLHAEKTSAVLQQLLPFLADKN